MAESLRRHWPEYLMEAAGLGLFMVSACVFAALLEHPLSPVRQAIADPFARRLLMGAAMGATAVAIIYSPWGKQSGAHLNPAVTFTFLRLGKIAPWDAAFYVLAQFAGGVAGVMLTASALGMSLLADPHVNYVVTLPGPAGIGPAFAAEAVISFALMLTVLVMSNRHEWNRYTGLAAGLLVALYIGFEAPISGMSLNPARSFASAVSAHHWNGLWLYFTAPPLGMLFAAELYLRAKGSRAVLCCKLNHENTRRCIFHCHYGEAAHRDGRAGTALPQGGHP